MDLLDGIRGDVGLREHTSMRVGGSARYFCEPSDETGVSAAVKAARRGRLPVCLLGGGSNIIFSDAGFHGIVIKFSGLRELGVRDGKIFAGAGVPLPRLLDYCTANGYGGAEFLAGIPGTVGGAFCMNAGALGGAMGDISAGARVCRMNGSIEEAPDISFDYRKTYYGGGAVLGVYMMLEKKDPEEVRGRIRENLDRRKKTQHIGGFTAGSVFKNPPGGYAGEIIERLGFKGYTVGDAMISNVHANFIVNRGHAKSRDIDMLIREIGSAVSRKAGIDLELEVKLVGRRNEI